MSRCYSHHREQNGHARTTSKCDVCRTLGGEPCAYKMTHGAQPCKKGRAMASPATRQQGYPSVVENAGLLAQNRHRLADMSFSDTSKFV